METKICIKCGNEYPLENFYLHPAMTDGHLGKCKNCVKDYVKARAKELSLDKDWLEKERSRGREKYHRLEYKEKNKPSYEAKKMIIQRYKEKYPEKISASSTAGNIKVKDGNEKHHWSYNDIHFKDIIELTNRQHNIAHRYMIYDQERRMYRTLNNILLDTKQSHLDYINQCLTKENEPIL